MHGFVWTLDDKQAQNLNTWQNQGTFSLPDILIGDSQHGQPWLLKLWFEVSGAELVVVPIWDSLCIFVF